MNTKPAWLYAVDAPGGLLAAHERAASTAQVAIPEAFQPAERIPENPRDPVYGEFLMAAVDEWFNYYGRFPSVAARHKEVIWAVASHLRDESGTPLAAAIARLLLLGDKGCGKSTHLQMLNLVCARTDDLVSEPTEPAFRSMLGPEKLTVLLDEADVLLGNGTRKAAIRAILNASAYPNGHVDRIQNGRRVKDYVRGPVALAALPYLESSTGAWLEPLLERSLIVHLARATEPVPQIMEDPGGQQSGRDAGELIALWMQMHLEAILEAIPTTTMPVPASRREEAMQRKAQIWRPLLAICDTIGGPWPEYGREAFLDRKAAASINDFTEKVKGLR